MEKNIYVQPEVKTISLGDRIMDAIPVTTGGEAAAKAVTIDLDSDEKDF